ncbi:ORF120 [Ostreid herpesvirus 1]|nr:ORF120 [Ostreid herpesvirus 1]UCX57223.1 ORF120 [Ostreid herpesvirus 1]
MCKGETKWGNKMADCSRYFMKPHYNVYFKPIMYLPLLLFCVISCYGEQINNLDDLQAKLDSMPPSDFIDHNGHNICQDCDRLCPLISDNPTCEEDCYGRCNRGDNTAMI